MGGDRFQWRALRTLTADPAEMSGSRMSDISSAWNAPVMGSHRPWSQEAMLLDLQATQAACRLLEGKCARQERQVEQLQLELQQSRTTTTEKSAQLLVEVEERQLSEGRQRMATQQCADTLRQREVQWAHKEEQLWREVDGWKEKHNLVASLMQAQQVAMSKTAAEMESELLGEIDALKNDVRLLQRELERDANSYAEQEEEMTMQMQHMREGSAQREATM